MLGIRTIFSPMRSIGDVISTFVSEEEILYRVNIGHFMMVYAIIGEKH